MRYFIILFVLVIACKSDPVNKSVKISEADSVVFEHKSDCESMQTSFSTYEEAEKIIEQTTFTFHETINTPSSSWIRSASFYSCDQRIGYLIIFTDQRNYIHKNVPLYLWLNFKDASSYGSFYNQNFKNQYQFSLN